MQTKDFTLAVTLIIHGYEYKMVRDGDVSYFIFDDTPELDRLVNDFWNRKLEVEPISFQEVSRQLKARIFDK